MKMKIFILQVGRKGSFTCLILPALPTSTTAEEKRRNKLSKAGKLAIDGRVTSRAKPKARHFQQRHYIVLFTTTTRKDGDPIKLPENLESLPRAKHFAAQRHRWNTNELRPSFLMGMEFSTQEALSGNLSDASQDLVAKRFNEESVGEKEPPGGAQNIMQGYVRAQVVSDKSVADCVEALIGTFLLNGGVLNAVKVLEWLQVLPPKDNFTSFLKKQPSTVLKEGKCTVTDIDFLLNNCQRDIEKIVNYKFKDPSFLLEALSHPSYIRNRLTRSYERLEFLGDAILDFLITAHIFENSNDLKPGDLTDLRSALVNNVTFASYVVKLGLHKFLCSQLNPTLDGAVMMFVEHQEQRGHEILEDVLYLIDEEDCQISEYVEVPKVLSDIFESLVGAVYLDSQGDLGAVWSVVYRIMHREIDVFSANIPQQPVRVLYERIHACPAFGTAQVVDGNISRVMIPVTFTKTGRTHTAHGFGGNKFQAKRAAAKLALKILDS